jgi:hypothetical protein
MRLVLSLFCVLAASAATAYGKPYGAVWFGLMAVVLMLSKIAANIAALKNRI